MLFRITLLFCLLSTVAYGQLKDNEKQHLAAKNLLANPGFENLTSGWTASTPAHLTTTTAAADVGDGKVSGVWDPTALNDFLVTAYYPVPNLLEGKACLAEFSYKWETGTLTHLTAKVQAQTGGDLLEALDLVPTTGKWSKYQVGFPCPEDDSVRIILSATDDGAPITLDNVHLGEDKRLGESAGGRVVGFEKITLADNISTPADNAIIVQKNDLKVGTTYRVTYAVAVAMQQGTGQKRAYFILEGSEGSDGQYVRDRLYQANLDANDDLQMAFTGGVTFKATQTDLILKIIDSDSVATIYGDSADPNANPTYMIVEELSEPEATVTLESQGWEVRGDIGHETGTTGLGTGAITVWDTVSNSGLTLSNEGSNPVGIACESIEGNESDGTCTGSSENVGIVFNAPYSGEFEACFHFPLSNVGSNVIFQLMRTENNSHTILEEGGPTPMGRSSNGGQSSTIPMDVCGYFNLVAGKNTLRLMREQSAAGTAPTIVNDREPTSGDRSLFFIVRPISQNMPQAIALTGIKNKWQKNTLITNLTATTNDIPDLRFENLTLGKTYRLTLQGYMLSQGGGTNTEVGIVYVNHGGNEITRLTYRHDNHTDWAGISSSAVVIFEATATSVTFDFSETGTFELYGPETYSILEELNNHEKVSTW